MNWEITIGLISVYLIWKAYKFRVYINKYLIPWQVDIVSNELNDGKYELFFSVVFGKGYFKKTYITASGHLTSTNEFTKKMLSEMLTLTEINTLLNPGTENADGSIIHNYKFFQSPFQKEDGNYDIIYYIITDEFADKINNIIQSKSEQ